jgi:hypothetical protein
MKLSKLKLDGNPMTITTSFYRAVGPKPHTEKAGEIVWDGKRITASEEWLQRLIREPIPVADKGTRRELYAGDDPELFVKSLWLYYTGSYMWATKPVIKE